MFFIFNTKHWFHNDVWSLEKPEHLTFNPSGLKVTAFFYVRWKMMKCWLTFSVFSRGGSRRRGVGGARWWRRWSREEATAWRPVSQRRRPLPRWDGVKTSYCVAFALQLITCEMQENMLTNEVFRCIQVCSSQFSVPWKLQTCLFSLFFLTSLHLSVLPSSGQTFNSLQWQTGDVQVRSSTLWHHWAYSCSGAPFTPVFRCSLKCCNRTILWSFKKYKAVNSSAFIRQIAANSLSHMLQLMAVLAV